MRSILRLPAPLPPVVLNRMVHSTHFRRTLKVLSPLSKRWPERFAELAAALPGLVANGSERATAAERARCCLDGSGRRSLGKQYTSTCVPAGGVGGAAFGGTGDGFKSCESSRSALGFATEGAARYSGD